MCVYVCMYVCVCDSSDVSIDLGTKTVTVTCDSGVCDVAALAPAVTAAGYEATLVGGSGAPGPAATTTVQLSVPGMMCMGSCGSKVKKALGGVVGVGGE